MSAHCPPFWRTLRYREVDSERGKASYRQSTPMALKVGYHPALLGINCAGSSRMSSSDRAIPVPALETSIILVGIANLREGDRSYAQNKEKEDQAKL
jgi:hypothetical protein